MSLPGEVVAERIAEYKPPEVGGAAALDEARRAWELAAARVVALAEAVAAADAKELAELLAGALRSERSALATWRCVLKLATTTAVLVPPEPTP